MLKIGIYEREITPFLGVSHSGYFTPRYNSGVRDKTYVKAAVIECGGELLAMLTIDSCMITDSLAENVYKRIAAYVDLKKENLLISATHSHTSGPIGCYEEREIDLFFIKMVEYAAADAVILAYQKRVEGKIKYTRGLAENIAFIRNFVLKDGRSRTNPGRLNPNIKEPIGKPDESVPVLLFEDNFGKKLGLVYSFGCHQDCIGGSEASGDFSSEVSALMKDKYGKDFVSAYFYGPAGNVNDVDINAPDPDFNTYYRDMGKVIFDAIEKALSAAEELQLNTFAVANGEMIFERRIPSTEELLEYKKIYESVELPEGVDLEASAPKEIFDACMAKRAYDYATESTKYHKYSLQVIRLDKVLVFALPGEVFTQYTEKIKKEFEGFECFFACLANNEWTYMPAPECYLPELYESLHGSAKLNACDVVKLFDEIIALGKSLI